MNEKNTATTSNDASTTSTKKEPFLRRLWRCKLGNGEVLGGLVVTACAVGAAVLAGNSLSGSAGSAASTVGQKTMAGVSGP